MTRHRPNRPRSHRALVPALAALLALGGAALAAAAPADLSQAYREWGESAVKFLMTQAEEKLWQSLSSDEEAEQFIRLFWAQRDPSPDTALNELRREVEQRVAFADQQFGTKETKGSLTDQGMVFILLGPPKRIQRPGATGASRGGDVGAGDTPYDTSGSVASGTGAGRFGTGGGTDRAGVASEERWIYEDDRLPEFVQRKRFTVRFLTKPGTEEVELTQASDVLGYLAEAKEVARTRPELTVEDVQVVTAGAAAAVAGELVAFRGEELDAGAAPVARLHSALGDGSGNGVDAHLDAGAFQASDGRWIVPLQVSATGSVPDGPARLVGELVDEGGETELAFRLEAPWQESKGQRYVKETLVAPAGSYELRAGLEDGSGKVVWAGSEKVEVPAAADGYWLSELVLSDNIYPMQEAQEMLEPYAWQGIAVVPKAGRTFRQGELLWFYVHACNPALGDSGEPTLKVNLVLEGPTSFRGPLAVQPAKAGDECWVVAQGIDLVPDRFPPGDYEMKVQVRDSLGSTTLSSGEEFTVVAP